MPTLTTRLLPLLLLALTLPIFAADKTYTVKLHRPDKPNDTFHVAAASAVRYTTRLAVTGRDPRTTSRLLAADIRGRVTILTTNDRGDALTVSWAVEKCTSITSDDGSPSDAPEEPLLPPGSTLLATAGDDQTTFSARDKAGKPIDLTPQQQYALRLVASLSTPNAPTSDDLYGTTKKQPLGASWPVNAKALADDAQRHDVAYPPESVNGTVKFNAIKTIDHIDFLDLSARIKITDVSRTKNDTPNLPPGLKPTTASRDIAFDVLIPADPTLPHLTFSRTHTWTEEAAGKTTPRQLDTTLQTTIDSTFEIRITPVNE